jgi:uncharacterized protein (DUF427 family)
VKEPGPDHPISIARNPRRVRVRFASATIADTLRALTLKEKGYQPVQYVPRADVKMSALTASSHRTHCPYKGDASYFTVTVNGRSAENAAWSYEAPFPAMRAIKNHLAFYPSRVDAIEEADG